MADIEKVIKGLECCTGLGCHHGCEYKSNGYSAMTCRQRLEKDALELLKEYAVIKETISDEIHETAKMFRRTEEDGWIERCDRRARQSLSD